MKTTTATQKAQALIERPAWKVLKEHYRKIRNVHLRSLFDDDPKSVERLVAEGRWFAVLTSGTEDIYKVYAESFRGAHHLRRVLEEAQVLVNDALAVAPPRSGLANPGAKT